MATFSIECSQKILDDTGCTADNKRKPKKVQCPSTSSTTRDNEEDALAAFLRAGWVQKGKSWTCPHPQHKKDAD